jgi:hemerythrin
MSTLKWNEDYGIGIGQFDNAHKVLLSLLNDISAAAEQPLLLQRQIVVPALAAFHTDIIHHFDSEERFMRETGYPEELYREHKEKHDGLVRELEDFIDTYQRTSGGLTQDRIVYLQDWLVWHMISCDKKMGAHAARQCAEEQ